MECSLTPAKLSGVQPPFCFQLFREIKSTFYLASAITDYYLLPPLSRFERHKKTFPPDLGAFDINVIRMNAKMEPIGKTIEKHYLNIFKYNLLPIPIKCTTYSHVNSR